MKASIEDIVVMTLIGIVACLLLAALGARMARRIGQPPVIGEILMGIALGPSLIGLLPGDIDEALFPPRPARFSTSSLRSPWRCSCSGSVTTSSSRAFGVGAHD